MAKVRIVIEVDESVRDEFGGLIEHCIDFNSSPAFFAPTNRRLLNEAQRIGRFNPHQIYILNAEEQRAVEGLRRRSMLETSGQLCEEVRDEHIDTTEKARVS